MSTAVESPRTEYVTFYVGDMLLGVEIAVVDEINRHVDVTPVPQAPRFVCGVVNLRGEVITYVDLYTILGLPPSKGDKATRTVIVRSLGERIGLMVDRIANVVKARPKEIAPVPPNLGGRDGRFFKGVYTMGRELLVVLDVEVALGVEPQADGLLS
ncbi:MAG: purine-binding chemotaxis protein CheW [bacterium]|nr:purine-binding chemotaxis protein CheW [bacterium]